MLYKKSVEELAQIIYDICRDRTKTSKEVTEDLLKELGIKNKLYSSDMDQCIDMIRRYRYSWKGLEDLSRNLKNILNDFTLENVLDKFVLTYTHDDFYMCKLCGCEWYNCECFRN